MEKKDIRIKINTGELDTLDPQIKQLLLDMKRHFNGIIFSMARFALAMQVEKKST
jgi:hypothetical protein